MVPNCDSLPVPKQYAVAFASQVTGLRGTPDELAALARRYRVAYSVTPEGATKDLQAPLLAEHHRVRALRCPY